MLPPVTLIEIHIFLHSKTTVMDDKKRFIDETNSIYSLLELFKKYDFTKNQFLAICEMDIGEMLLLEFSELYFFNIIRIFDAK